MQLPFLPLSPIEAYETKPHLWGTQPIAVLSPEDRERRIAKRRRDIALVMQNEPYLWYARHVRKREDMIPVPRIRVDELGVRSWLGVMRQWKRELYAFREKHSKEETPSEPASDVSMPDLRSDQTPSELDDAMSDLSLAPPTPPLGPSTPPPLSWASVVGGVEMR